MRPSRSLRQGQRSQAQGSGHARRRRGAPSHNQTASRNYENERDYQNPSTLTPIVQYNFYHHLPMGGTTQLVQIHSSTGYMMGGVFVATASTITTTVSTESYMEYGPSMGPYTLASKPPEPRPSHAVNHDLNNFGAQFFAGGTPSLGAGDGAGDYTGLQDGRSPYPPVMDVGNDGRAGVFDPAGMSDLGNRGDTNFDPVDLLPSDPSKAYLESLPDEAWDRPIPLRIRRASPFPSLDQYEEDVMEDLADNLETLQVSIG